MTSKLAAATKEIIVICVVKLIDLADITMNNMQTQRTLIEVILSFIVYETKLCVLRHGTAAAIFGYKVHLASSSPFNLSLLLSVDRATKNHNRIYSICVHLNIVCASSGVHRSMSPCACAIVRCWPSPRSPKTSL